MVWKQSPLFSPAAGARTDWILPAFDPITRLAIAQISVSSTAVRRIGFLSFSRTVIVAGNPYLLVRPVGSIWRERTEYAIGSPDFQGALIFDRSVRSAGTFQFRFLYFQP